MPRQSQQSEQQVFDFSPGESGDSDEEWLNEEFRRLRYAGGIQ